MTSTLRYGRVLLTTLIIGNGAPIGVIWLIDQPGPALATLIAIFTAMGLGSGIANVHAVSLRQTTVAPALRSRMNAGYRTISWGAIPLGAAIGGVLAGRVGIEQTMLIGAVGVALATAPVALSPIPRLTTIRDAGKISTWLSAQLGSVARGERPHRTRGEPPRPVSSRTGMANRQSRPVRRSRSGRAIQSCESGCERTLSSQVCGAARRSWRCVTRTALTRSGTSSTGFSGRRCTVSPSSSACSRSASIPGFRFGWT